MDEEIQGWRTLEDGTRVRLTYEELLDILENPGEDATEYTMPKGYYTREGDVVTFHAQVPDNDAPLINWFGWDQEVFDKYNEAN